MLDNNNNNSIKWTREKDANGKLLGGDLKTQTTPENDHTVVEKTLPTYIGTKVPKSIILEALT